MLLVLYRPVTLVVVVKGANLKSEWRRYLWNLAFAVLPLSASVFWQPSSTKSKAKIAKVTYRRAAVIGYRRTIMLAR